MDVPSSKETISKVSDTLGKGKLLKGGKYIAQGLEALVNCPLLFQVHFSWEPGITRPSKWAKLHWHSVNKPETLTVNPDQVIYTIYMLALVNMAPWKATVGEQYLGKIYQIF
ncbi:hypothetical protein BDV93DRAFT_514994 [Ceratobasidium sp. AG-I]|nr:hypothetical protein BDV93DRAFT_514994 [Ceratobasidium sp. AG-I]